MSTDTNSISLVIFTCEGREHLLYHTINSFNEICNYKFSKIILAIDGQISHSVVDHVKPDVIIQSYQRKGYVNSIIETIAHIQTPYFFWLEDDFMFNQQIQFEYLMGVMHNHPNWAGIFLSRTAPLTMSDKKTHHFDHFYLPSFGYSVSPALCNTKHLKAGLKALVDFPKNEKLKVYGFETFLDDYFIQHGLSYAMPDPGETPHVIHTGKLESTAREYHMINSIDKNVTLINKEYISGFGYNKKIKLKNKAGAFFKLWLATSWLSLKLWSSREAYDFAFRIYLSYLNKFKN